MWIKSKKAEITIYENSIKFVEYKLFDIAMLSLFYKNQK